MFVRWQKLENKTFYFEALRLEESRLIFLEKKLEKFCKTNEFIIRGFDFVNFMFLFRDFRIRTSHKIILGCEFIETGVFIIPKLLFFTTLKIKK